MASFIPKVLHCNLFTDLLVRSETRGQRTKSLTLFFDTKMWASGEVNLVMWLVAMLLESFVGRM